MEKKLLILNSNFITQYKGLLDINKSIFENLKSYEYDLDNREISDAIIDRMDAFWHFHVNNNIFLDRKSNTVAADFFTETCLFFLKSYFGDRYLVKSEENINEKGTKIVRPDISIWDKQNKLVAVIEIKVSNGWKGKNIINHLEERENSFNSINSNAFFGVIAFWIFEENNQNWGNKYIGLKKWNEKEKHPKTNFSIENLIKSLEEHIKINF